MTIMFAGGLAVGAPTMFPDTDAQSSQTLFVSTTTLQGGAVLEITVDDPTLRTLDTEISPPVVRANGNITPLMVQTNHGTWVAYIADTSQVAASEGISSIGWDWGSASCTAGIGSGAIAGGSMIGTKATTGIQPYVQLTEGADRGTAKVKAVATQCLDGSNYGQAPNDVKGAPADVTGNIADGSATDWTFKDEINMLQSIPSINAHSGLGANNKGQAGMEINATDNQVSHWPLIQTWELDPTTDFCYGAECVTVSRDTTDSLISISVDKTTVADNDHIVLEITDPGLNLDPTFPDEWTFGVTQTAGSETLTWRGNMTDTYGGNTALTRANIKTAGFGDGGYLAVTDGGSALNSATITVYETGANTGVFTSLMSNDTSDLRTGAQSSASGDDVITINYAGNKINLIVAYTDMSMTLDAGDEWTAGEAATLTIVDSDSNKMSNSAETLDTNDEGYPVPTITLGSPYWCNDNSSVTIDAATISSPRQVDNDSKRCQFASTALTADTVTHINTTLGSATGADLAKWDMDGTVVIGYDVSEIADLIEDTAAITEIRVEIATNVTRNSVAGTETAHTGEFLLLSTGNVSKKGTYKCQDMKHAWDCTNLTHASAPIVSVIITHGSAALAADTYAISTDIMHFDQDDTSVAHDAIYRVEAVETGPDTGVFEGTVAYMNMNASNTDAAMQDSIVQNNQNVIIGIHSGVSGTDAPRVEFNDTNSVGSFSTVGAQLSTNNYTGILEWDQASYAAGDTAVVTITDPDLNQDNGLLETYSNDTVGTGGTDPTTTFTVTCINSDGTEQACVNASVIKVVEDGSSSGTFSASFAVPGNIEENTSLSSTVGNNMKLKYYDSNDAGGSAVLITSSAAISSTTGSITLDKSVYPTPWGGVSGSKLKCGDNSSTTNCSTVYGNVTIWVTVHEPDNANDTLACKGSTTVAASGACVVFKLGSTAIAYAGNDIAGATSTPFTSTTNLQELGPLSETSQGS